MHIQYIRNRNSDDEKEIFVVNKNSYYIPPPEKTKGPFESCGTCPYASHGFFCFSKEGDCLKTKMNKNNRRKDNEYNS